MSFPLPMNEYKSVTHVPVAQQYYLCPTPRITAATIPYLKGLLKEQKPISTIGELAPPFHALCSTVLCRVR
jgi:hypothetical protein